jgi:hypothetical protein
VDATDQIDRTVGLGSENDRQHRESSNYSHMFNAVALEAHHDIGRIDRPGAHDGHPWITVTHDDSLTELIFDGPQVDHLGRF